MLALMLSLGCFKATYTTDEDVSGDKPEHEIWRNRVLYGIIEIEDPVNIEELCRGGFAQIHTEVDLLAALATIGPSVALSWVAGLGLLQPYAPSNVHVWCKNGAAYRATVTPDGAVVYLEAPIGQEIPEELGGSLRSASGTEAGAKHPAAWPAGAEPELSASAWPPKEGEVQFDSPDCLGSDCGILVHRHHREGTCPHFYYWLQWPAQRAPLLFRLRMVRQPKSDL
ncbi:MAG: hypothetical protein ACI9VR_002137 [Cognaticolwellia sp.]|jgi:hypothetical protein